ncbi:MAG: hypothetical protein J07HR59_00190 [Halorubrum sp. J07HR59]|nr:MAG: hypothetical protein J07HX5_01426 [halophilic archaeon J07HX5]ERH04840.1 MAG: hypothetical protein J07HR59_00190 [Halorubrum sp. J07HR59]
MCRYCAYSYHDGWTALLEYDDTYQQVTSQTTATHGFHQEWDELREEISV